MELPPEDGRKAPGIPEDRAVEQASMELPPEDGRKAVPEKGSSTRQGTVASMELPPEDGRKSASVRVARTRTNWLQWSYRPKTVESREGEL